MRRDYDIKKYGADKIVLLGLFILSVLIARFIIVSKSAVKLTEPINLSYTGLSVSMPSGNGWQSGKQWKYQENCFTIGSVFSPGTGKVAAQAICRYLLAAPVANVDVQFKQKAADVSGEIVKTDEIRTDLFTVEWAYIKTPNTHFEIFFGTALLPYGRRLDIEVRQNTGDTRMAEEFFKSIADSLKFEDNSLLKLGSEIIEKIKSTGLNNLIYNHNQQSFFLIKDEAANTVGFTMDVLIDSASQARLNIQAASLFYIQGWFVREKATLFQSNNGFNQIQWKSETRTVIGSVGTEMTVDANGLMTVRKSNRWGEEEICRLGPAAIPEILLEFAFCQMLDNDYQKIILDIIDADGTITPAVVSRTQSDENTAASQDSSETDSGTKERVEYVLNLELLTDSGFSKQVLYFDKHRQIFKRLLARPSTEKGIGKLLHQKDTYILERTSLDDITKRFPVRANRFLQNTKILEQNQPQH